MSRNADDFKSLGSRPHSALGEFLMKFSGRKDGQFRSGGLLVGDRPFFCPQFPVVRAKQRDRIVLYSN